MPQEAAGNMEFVIVRPGGLKTEPATGNAVLTEDNTVCGGIHREDCADLIVNCLFSDKAKNKVRCSWFNNQSFRVRLI